MNRSWLAAFGVGVVGTVVTLTLISTFERQLGALRSQLNRANHRAALKIISRDVDDIRRQMADRFRNVPPAHFDFLFFARDGAGRMGVHGPSVDTWTPVSNAQASVFRAALGGLSGSVVRIVDLSGQLIDANFPTAPAGARDLNENINGTNMVIRSSPSPAPAWPGFYTTLFLTVLFWTNVALVVHFITINDDDVVYPRPSRRASLNWPQSPAPARVSAPPRLMPLETVVTIPTQAYRFHEPIEIAGHQVHEAPPEPLLFLNH